MNNVKNCYNIAMEAVNLNKSLHEKDLDRKLTHIEKRLKTYINEYLCEFRIYELKKFLEEHRHDGDI